MDSNEEKINELLIRLDNLLLKQQSFDDEIKALRAELNQFKSKSQKTEFRDKRTEPLQPESIFPPKLVPPPFTPPRPTPASTFSEKFKKENLGKSEFEKFIGENLISKIGILILIIGVVIGAKLAIEKDLISPLTRVIFGYLTGIGLLGFAIRLKTKYESFSAVLLSGAIAILYFMTFAAHSYYQLIPQIPAFALMVILTGFTVFAAIKYDRQVIAHIGLVGAYAVPFLLSNNSGNVVVLFTYISLINIGILILSFRKYWKVLFYLSFAVTWIIFAGWQMNSFHENNFVSISLVFSFVNFLTFYLTNLAYKTLKSENFEVSDVILLMLNSSMFYGIGYSTLRGFELGKDLLGLFTLGNGIIHFIVSMVIYKRNLADKKLFYFLLALVITFITIAVPVQLHGNWITIFWALEAGILFYFGTQKNIDIFEKLSLGLVCLAFFSFIQDGFVSSQVYRGDDYISLRPFLNTGFLSACLFIGSFLWMFLLSRREPLLNSTFRKFLTYSISITLIIVTYFAFGRELTIIFDNLYDQSKLKISPRGDTYFVYNENYSRFGSIASYCYTLFFATALTLLNLKKLKSKELAVANLIINTMVIITFLTHGLYILSELRDSYIDQSNQYFASGKMNIVVRYISFGFFITLVAICYRLSKSTLFKINLKTAFDYALYLSILWVLSSELLHLLALNGLTTGYKLGLSILWGSYSLCLIGIGIWKGKKFIRVGGIALFAITLMKLFFYDLTSLNTLSKTIVFVALGILLLIISFLYNKYKHLIDDGVEAKN